MIGEIVWQSGNYAETVELESDTTRLVTCQGGGSAPMYRLEYQENGQDQHSAYHGWAEAEANFERKAGA